MRINYLAVTFSLVCSTTSIAQSNAEVVPAETQSKQLPANAVSENKAAGSIQNIKQVENKQVQPMSAPPVDGELVMEEIKSPQPTPSFNVFEFKVDGNTVLPAGKIEEAVYPFLGETKTIADVEKARSVLEKTYQDAGYLTVSVTIPQQEVDAGIVTLKVTEGSVERLRVTESKYTSLAEVKSRVGEFSEGKVPHFPTAQAQLGTVNRGQNRQVTPVLRAGKSPGKVEVDLKVQDQLPLHGNLEINDRYAPNTTKTRLNGGLRYENLWQKDHSVGISFQVSPEDFSEVQVVSGTYVIPRMNGDYFAAYGVISNSDISAVGDVTVIGKGNIVGARYIHPLPLVENYYHSVTAGADYKDFKESVNLLNTQGFKNPISYVAFMLGYDGTYQAETAQLQFNFTANFAPRGLGNDELEFDNRRRFAKPNYAYLRSDIKYTQKLPYDWALQARLSTQVSNNPLIGVEQFTLGGVDSVRGYLESSELGDDGAFASVELRTPPFKKFIQNKSYADLIKDLYAFSFIDAGYSRLKDITSSEDNTSNISSAGIGVKLKTTKGIFTNIDYAYAFKDSSLVKSGDDRLHFRVGYEW
jgi:hemolysin activation/secretion protein